MSNSSNKTDWTLHGGPQFPTTGEIGLVESPQAAVVAAFVAWRQELHHTLTVHQLGGGIADGLHRLLPLTVNERLRWVFFSLGNWTAFFDNGARGTDAGPTASHLAQTMRCRGARVVCVADGLGAFPSTILEIYGPKPTEFLNYVRTISATNDGGRWRFDVSGAPQLFERQASYSNKRIRDRFTPEMLENYLGELGACAFDSRMYRAPVLIERTDKTDFNQLSLEQARARFTVGRSDSQTRRR